MADRVSDQDDVPSQPERGLDSNESREDGPSAPRQEDRGRRRSPQKRNDEDRPRRKDAGFRWKEKRRDDPDTRNGEQDKSLRRGYKDHYRPRSRSPTRTERNTDEKATVRDPDKKESKEKKEKKRAAAPAPPQEEMIRVRINDRLGTATTIPCFASDNIKAFKSLVAIQIGRKPHEILLKRQGERPFKDQLTLADYGVSNGVQLDL